MQLISKYFPDLDPVQTGQFEKLLQIIPVINEKVNIISRKDVGSLEERHILHSLSIARKFCFAPGTRILDAGTGGGFPGIPLAILFPGSDFILVDSIQKKVGMVREIASHLELDNAIPLRQRVETIKEEVDFVVSRAVTAFPLLYRWTSKLIRTGGSSNLPNGLISLKGGRLEDELKPFGDRVQCFPVSTWFAEPFFSTKMIVYIKK